MRFQTLAAVLASFAITAVVDAQQTITLPFEDGDTIVVSTGTNALGVPVTETLSTVWSTGLATMSSSSSSSARTTPLTATVTASSSSTSTSTRTTLLDDPLTETTPTTTANNERPTTTTQRGNVYNTPETNGPPMRTTTYWYDPGDGDWVEAVWTASNTVPPSEPTVTVPAGVVQEYDQYQTSVNRAVISNAVAADSRRNSTSGAGTRITPVETGFTGVGGLAAMVVGVVGMGWGVWAL